MPSVPMNNATAPKPHDRRAWIMRNALINQKVTCTVLGVVWEDEDGLWTDYVPWAKDMARFDNLDALIGSRYNGDYIFVIEVLPYYEPGCCERNPASQEKTD